MKLVSYSFFFQENPSSLSVLKFVTTLHLSIQVSFSGRRYARTVYSPQCNIALMCCCLPAGLNCCIWTLSDCLSWHMCALAAHNLNILCPFLLLKIVAFTFT